MTRNDTNQQFDRRLREVHAAAAGAVSGRTQLQLQLQFRRGAAAVERTPLRRLAWPLAAACAAAALAIGLQLRQPPVPPTATVPVAIAPAATATTDEEAYLALEESPDLYLWLASEDAAILAME
jgi:hypothetical protein